MNFKTSFLNSKKLPLVIEPEGEIDRNLGPDFLVSLCLEKRSFFQAELLQSGALLFRRFGVREADQFERVVRAFSGKKLLNYAGGVSPRIEYGGGVYSSTEYPAEFTLSPHNELSYSSNYPAEVYFCCTLAPERGGETPIGDSRRILKNIDRQIVDEFKRKKIRYYRNLPGEAGSGYSWQEAFETRDKRVVESLCRKMGADFKWERDGRLHLAETRPATVFHPKTGEEVWFNQADGFHPSNVEPENYLNMNEEDFRLNARFGDGTPFDVSALGHIRRVLRNEMTLFPWQAGDVLVLDNLLTAHGRMAFSGARKVILAMT